MQLSNNLGLVGHEVLAPRLKISPLLIQEDYNMPRFELHARSRSASRLVESRDDVAPL